MQWSQSASFYMHYTKDTYFIATGIRGFKAELLKKYREYLKQENNRITLHNILTELKNKGYNITQAKYKKIPKILDKQKDEIHMYLSLYDSMFAFSEFTINKTFYTVKILDECFSIYDDMKELQAWLYKMTIS
jgi:uncharacterized protein (DUF2461 family)